MSSSSPHPPEADAPSAPVVDQPRNDDSSTLQHGRVPVTPPGSTCLDKHVTPARPGVNAARLEPGLPQDDELRQHYLTPDSMENKIREISVEDMFKDYLQGGGEPSKEDYEKFHYDADGLSKVRLEVELMPIICQMGQSVAKQAGKKVLFRDISDARDTDQYTISENKNTSSTTGKKTSQTASGSSTNDPQSSTRGKGKSKDEGTTPRSHATTPDIAVYRDDDRAKPLVIKADDYKKKTKSSKEELVNKRQHWVAHRSWSDIVAFVEAKVDHSKCAFEFLHPNTTNFNRARGDDDDDGGKKGGKDGLGQFQEYNAQVLGHQHRTHLFSAYFYKDHARLAYADRSGAVVSQPFKYGDEHNRTLHRFFWKIACMEDEELGFDHTAKLATKDDVEALREYAATLPTDYLKRQAYDALSWNPKAKEGKQLKSFEWPVYKLTMVDNVKKHEEGEEKKKEEEERIIFAGRPSFATASVFGRCTRAYPVFEEVGEKDGKRTFELRFLKDSWRVQDPNGRIHPEHEVYERLEVNEVTGHVLTCVQGGDVLNQNGTPQVTKLHAIDPECPHHPRVHYRILLKEVCRPLTDFEDFRELSAILRDALQGHKDAWEKAGVLHRDVSFNNILIHEFKDEHGVIVRKGILNDWDLSKYKEDMETGTEPREPDHTGTWLFRSAVLGRYPRKPYQLSDDIESFVHVHHYSVLRFHYTEETAELKSIFHSHFGFHNFRPEDGAHLGGRPKFINMGSNRPFISPTDNDSLQEVLYAIASLCSRHYGTIDEIAYGKLYTPLAANTARADDPPRKRHLFTPSSNPEDKTLENHDKLLSLFESTSKEDFWQKYDLKKSSDLFKTHGLASGKNNQLSSSATATKRSRDAEPTKPKKKLKGPDGTPLGPLAETPEPSADQEE